MKLFYTITCYLNVEEIGINSKLLIIPGYLAGIGCLVFMTQRTLLAFFSEQKAVTIYINRYGEQYLDLLSLIILWVISLIGLFLLLVYVKREQEPQPEFRPQPVMRNDTPSLSLLNESFVDSRREATNGIVAKTIVPDDHPADDTHLLLVQQRKTSDEGMSIKK